MQVSTEDIFCEIMGSFYPQYDTSILNMFVVSYSSTKLCNFELIPGYWYIFHF